MAYVIAEPCRGCKDASCVEVCPCDCIHSGEDEPMYYIDPDPCIDCGACLTVCPAEAIFHEDDLSLAWRGYAAINAAYFAR